MKKYYYITFLALLVITLLQGYNISFLYKTKMISLAQGN